MFHHRRVFRLLYFRSVRADICPSRWSKHVPQLASGARYPQNKIVSQLLPLLWLHPSWPAKRAPAASPGTQLRLVDRGRCRVEGPWLVERQVALASRPLFTAISRVRPCACVMKGYVVN